MDDKVLKALYETVLSRKENKQEGSYTCYLFEKGLDKILKKVGEECSETIIAAKNGDNAATVYEISTPLFEPSGIRCRNGISPVRDVALCRTLDE